MSDMLGSRQKYVQDTSHLTSIDFLWWDTVEIREQGDTYAKWQGDLRQFSNNISQVIQKFSVKNSKLYELLCPALKQIMKKHQTVQVVQGQIIYNYSKYVRNMIAPYNERSI